MSSVTQERFSIETDDLDAAEVERQLWESASDSARFYQDGPHHGSPAAESKFRGGFYKIIRDAVDPFLGIDLTDKRKSNWSRVEDAHQSLDDRKEQITQSREQFNDDAAIGQHVFCYREGHEVEAAWHRGRCHGLALVDRLFDEYAKTGSDDQNAVVRGLVSWLPLLREWAEGDCTKPVPPPVLLASTASAASDPQHDAVPQHHVERSSATALTSPPGFCTEFVNHANATAKRLQPKLALMASLAVLASLIGRKVRDRRDTRANVYFVGLASTGSGKEHARGVSKLLLAEIGRAGILVEAFASAQGVVAKVAESLDVLALVDEFGKYLKAAMSKFAESFESKIVTVIMRLFTSSNSVFIGDTRANLEQKTVHNPNFVLYGTTTKAGFFESLSSANLVDGFINRLIVLPVDDELPLLLDNEPKPLPESLIDDANFWSAFSPGNGNLSAVTPTPYTIPETEDATARLREFSNHCDELARASSSEAVRGLLVRNAEKAGKLAIVYACSESREPVIGLAAAEWAINFATVSTQFVIDEASKWIADTPHQTNVKKVLRLIDNAGANGLPGHKLTKALDHALNAKDIREILAELIDSEKVFVKEVTTRGATGKVLFSSRFQT